MAKGRNYPPTVKEIFQLKEMAGGCKANEIRFFVSKGKKKTTLQVWFRTKANSCDQVYTKMQEALMQKIDWLFLYKAETRQYEDLGPTRVEGLNDYYAYFKWNDINKYL